MTLRLVSLFVMMTALTGACAPSFEAELNDVEGTQRGVRIPAVPATTTGGDVAVAGGFTLSSTEIAWAKRVNSDVRVHQVKIAVGAGVPNLDFIACARITAAVEGHPETATEIMIYERDDSASVGSVIQVEMPSPVDITTLWTASQTVIGLNIAGHMPAQDWSVDVTLNLSGKINYTY